jgi:lysozyme family protein
MAIETYGLSVAYILSRYTDDPTDNDDIRASYKTTYWDIISGDDLPQGLDLCVFDFQLTVDTETAVSSLQSMVGATVTGTMDTATLTAVDDYVLDNGLQETIETYQSRKDVEVFTASRISDVQSLAIELIDYEDEEPPENPPGADLIEPDDYIGETE